MIYVVNLYNFIQGNPDFWPIYTGLLRGDGATKLGKARTKEKRVENGIWQKRGLGKIGLGVPAPFTSTPRPIHRSGRIPNSVFTIFRLIWNQTDVRLLPNQSGTVYTI